ncbi:hypothetical protein EHC66_21000 [Vibrio parahaemolyticus]|nr:hypothetical protein EHC70_20345 [Vibrio parahaemolyticus]QHH01643.1 hypothetical protein EHC64_21395 [Vibrio parahaemolyticus]QHH06757.1 hypothetical protein EHC66_21000 [Vibrio parahaemolyticus]
MIRIIQHLAYCHGRPQSILQISHLKCEAIAHLKPQRHRRLQLKWFGVLNSMSTLSMKASTYGYFQVLY